jgi:SAM-dependent methyltransferase
VLNVGGGSRAIPIPSHYSGWRHDLLDIDARQEPDLLLDARDLRSLPAATYDAIYCSHNLEHYHRHHAARVVAGFHHILKPDGFAEILVPNLLNLMRTVVERGLDVDDVLYQSDAAPILVRDVIYGHSEQVETGNEFFSHKTGFSPKTLAHFVGKQGFPIQAMSTPNPLEIRGLFFKTTPTAEQMAMLNIRQC